MKYQVDQEWVDEHRAYIAVCEAGWKGSPCWHVVDWMTSKLRNKYPLVRIADQVICLNLTCS